MWHGLEGGWATNFNTRLAIGQYIKAKRETTWAAEQLQMSSAFVVVQQELPGLHRGRKRGVHAGADRMLATQTRR